MSDEKKQGQHHDSGRPDGVKIRFLSNAQPSVERGDVATVAQRVADKHIMNGDAELVAE